MNGKTSRSAAALGLFAATLGGGASLANDSATPDQVESLVQQRCGYERLAEAEAACVGALADGVMLVMDQRIASLTTGLQAASSAELSAFETGLTRSQARWRRETEARCRNRGAARGAMKAARQICRLAAGLDRERQLDKALQGDFAELAGLSQAGYAPLGAVQLRIPLAGGGVRPGLELEIPLTRY